MHKPNLSCKNHGIHQASDYTLKKQLAFRSISDNFNPKYFTCYTETLISNSSGNSCSKQSIPKWLELMINIPSTSVQVHEEEGIGPDELVGDVLYYGDSHSGVVQLHSRSEVEKLIGEQKGQGRLVVLDVGLKHCGPCVKVYPTVVKLSRSMSGSVVFARMNGDENDSCMGFLSDMGVVEVPTFLFIKDGEICGRYVGSGKGELIGEILRYQGVRVT